jgi:hypothetical protein
MKKLLLILGLLLSISKANGQVINWVNYEYQADIKVYFTQYKYDADIIACKAKYKYQTDKPGYWWWEGDRMDVGNRVYSSHIVNVFQVKYKYQADYVVYLSSHGYEIKLTEQYINEVYN